MTDKRIEKRLERKVRVRVVDGEQSFPAITEDISPHGLKIRSGRRYAAQQRVAIELASPSLKLPLAIPATISWDDEHAGADGAVTREMGVHFEDPPPNSSSSC